VQRHRDAVFAEYAENEEANAAHRALALHLRAPASGCGKTATLPASRCRAAPSSFMMSSTIPMNSATSRTTEHAKLVEQFTRELAEHLKRTAAATGV